MASGLGTNQPNIIVTYIGVEQEGSTNVYRSQAPLPTPQNVFTNQSKLLSFAKGMVIASLNINSLPLHKDEISSFINKKGIHVLALNETKVEKQMKDNLLDIEGYKIE